MAEVETASESHAPDKASTWSDCELENKRHHLSVVVVPAILPEKHHRGFHRPFQDTQGDMAQWVKVFTSKFDDLGLILKITW